MRFSTKNWREERATVQRTEYSDGTPKLTVKDRYGKILCDATISLRDLGESPKPGHVFIRNYGDNEGVLAALQDAGVLGRTVRILDDSSFTCAPLMHRPIHECPLLIKDGVIS